MSERVQVDVDSNISVPFLRSASVPLPPPPTFPPPHPPSPRTPPPPLLQPGPLKPVLHCGPQRHRQVDPAGADQRRAGAHPGARAPQPKGTAAAAAAALAARWQPGGSEDVMGRGAGGGGGGHNPACCISLTRTGFPPPRAPFLPHAASHLRRSAWRCSASTTSTAWSWRCRRCSTCARPSRRCGLGVWVRMRVGGQGWAFNAMLPLHSSCQPF